MEKNTHQEMVTNNILTTDKDKTVAILSYFSIIGCVIAFVLHGKNKTTLGAYHLRQTIALFIIGFCTWMLQILLAFVPYIGWAIDILLMGVYIGLLVLWILGFIAAINRQKYPVPLIGTKAQQWFEGIK